MKNWVVSQGTNLKPGTLAEISLVFSPKLGGKIPHAKFNFKRNFLELKL